MYHALHRSSRSPNERPRGGLIRLGLALALAATLVAPIAQATPPASAHHVEQTLEVWLDAIHVLDDSDGFLRGSGELEYWIDAQVGSSQCVPNWGCDLSYYDPVEFNASTGDVRRNLGKHRSGLRPRGSEVLGVRVSGRELDDGTADELGTVHAQFDGSQNWGIGSHTIENSYFRAEFRIVAWLTPDLEVTRIFIDGNEPHYGSLPARVCAEIHNDGSREASAFGVTMNVAGSPVTLAAPAALAAHRYAEYCGSATVPPGAHEVSVVIDPDDAVLESDANNNRRRETFTWTAAPDLRVEDLWSTGLLVEGEPQEICTRVSNAGPGAAGAFSFGIKIGRFFGYDVPPNSSKRMTGLASGGRVEHCVSVAEPATVWGLSMVAEVDHWSEVVEVSESNNEGREHFTIHEPLPDLMVPSNAERPGPLNTSPAVSSIGIVDKANASVSDCDPGKHNIAVRIKNAGYLAAGAFGVALTVDGKAAGTREVAALARGTSTTVTFQGVDLKARHLIGVSLDSRSQVAEMKENNNNAEMWVSCVAE